MLYYIEFEFGSEWIRLPGEFKSRDDAHWALAEWRHKNNCPEAQECFRVKEIG